MAVTDIIIIGAGIIGCAIARELSRYDISIIVIDSANDVAEGATKANSGIIHAGFDAVPGSRKAYYNRIGSDMYPEFCEYLGVAYHQCGALVLGFSGSERKIIENLYERGHQNRVEGLRILGREEILILEPNANPNVLCGLYAPTSAVVSPYEVTFALADEAAANGSNFIFDEDVLFVVRNNEGEFCVRTSRKEYRCKVVINCSGSSGAVIHNQLSETRLSMTHRRGQYFLLEKMRDPLFSRTIFQCPSEMGKGILISPTVHGNLIIGPTAEDVEDPFDTSTTYTGLADVLEGARHICPPISVKTNITNFSGIRSRLNTGDFEIGQIEGIPGAFEAIGIESPGLSSAPAIAVAIRDMVVEYMGASKKADVLHYKSIKAFYEMSDHERAKAVEEDPLYGNIVCRCEMVTESEIRGAIRRPVGAKSIDAVKRRTRAGMGRCQGGFCLPRIAAIIAEETGTPLLAITKNGGRSHLLMGTVGHFLKGDESIGERS